LHGNPAANCIPINDGARLDAQELNLEKRFARKSCMLSIILVGGPGGLVFKLTLTGDSQFSAEETIDTGRNPPYEQWKKLQTAKL